MYFIDTETVGLHGVPVLLQYAKDDGEIILYELWKHKVSETINLLDTIAAEGVIGFNLTFDWFHLSKFRCMLALCDGDMIPYGNIEHMASIEKQARDGGAFKPKTALDLFLYGCKGKYQSLMNRKPIRIRSVPGPVATLLAKELSKRVKLDDIFFTKGNRAWRILPTKKQGFVDLELKTSASRSLKAISKYVLGKTSVTKFEDVEVPPEFQVNDKPWGYAPFYEAMPKTERRWPEVVGYHIYHWGNNEHARQYATDDIINTRDLYKHYGCPPMGDNDSVLACMVGTTRWRGFELDIDALKALKEVNRSIAKSAPTAPAQSRIFLEQVLLPLEIQILSKEGKTGTGKHVLEHFIRSPDWEGHPIVERATMIRDARRATKKIETINKLLLAGRLHASFKIIGAKSSRMSGTDKLNPQGFARALDLRACFTYRRKGEKFCGGDFDAFEIALMCAAYPDKKLQAVLDAGKKIHALFAMGLYDVTYEQTMASKEKGYVGPPMYDEGKTGIFAMAYRGNADTLVRKINCSLERAVAAFNKFSTDYPEMFGHQEAVVSRFRALRQPKGIGTAVEFVTPDDYIESMFGFRRYFTIENSILKALFDLAQKPPKEWRALEGRVIRRDREQSISGATQSALYAASFGLQGNNERAAANHVIQSPGADICKDVQTQIWEVQPVGYHDWCVANMNVHDEVLAAVADPYVDQVANIVNKTVAKYKSKVPMIKMEWKKDMQTWAEK